MATPTTAELDVIEMAWLLLVWRMAETDVTIATDMLEPSRR